VTEQETAVTDQERDTILDEAMNADYKPGPRTYFGQVKTDVWPCALVKGQGKVPFDPAQHSPDERRIAIDITLAAWSSKGGVFQVERSMVAESREWARIVKPSLQAIGQNLRGLNMAWVRVDLVPTGDSYRNSQGETKERTTFRFLAPYASEAECQEAMEAFYAQHRPAQPANQDDGAEPTASRNGSGTASDADKATALKFIPALWRSCGGDVQKFERLLAGTPMVAKHFQINSPEVLAVISGN
jgi:hypothetical protein